jgi:hypothetical protein
LVSEKESLVWKGDKWGNRTWATVEVRATKQHLKNKKIKNTVTLVLLNTKWYIDDMGRDLLIDDPRQLPDE